MMKMITKTTNNMCGLIAFLGRPETKNATKILLDQYEMQSGRGKQGFGLIEVNKNTFNVKRSMGEARAIHDISLSPAKIMLFHHRYPTSTGNVHDQTHPMVISNEELSFDWLIMHNGVISNDDELKKIHESIGYQYRTETIESYQYSGTTWSRFNDSEAFAIEVARFLEGKSDVIGIHGSAAFIALKVNKTTQKPLSIIVGRNGKNPLDMELTEDGILIASDIKNDKKVEIPAFMAYEIEIKHLTGKTFGKLKELMPLHFVKEPEIKTMGFGSGMKQDFDKSTSVKTYDYPYGNTAYHADRDLGVNDVEEPELIYDDERMEAFDRMQGRIENDISEQLSIMFADLSYEDDPDKLILNEHIMKMEEILKDAHERIGKARDYFNKQADMELEDYQNSLPLYDHESIKISD